MKIDLSKMATFGVAGNFTGHLEQAGEAVDFTNVKTKEAKAPKAVAFQALYRRHNGRAAPFDGSRTHRCFHPAPGHDQHRTGA